MILVVGPAPSVNQQTYRHWRCLAAGQTVRISSQTSWDNVLGFAAEKRRYGYRRLWWLLRREGVRVKSCPVIRREQHFGR